MQNMDLFKFIKMEKMTYVQYIELLLLEIY